jgi:hypothetical protein
MTGNGRFAAGAAFMAGGFGLEVAELRAAARWAA